MKLTKRLFIVVTIISFLILTPLTYSYWNTASSPSDSYFGPPIRIGDFEIGDSNYPGVPAFDPNKPGGYTNGEKFVFDGKLFKVIKGNFDASQFLDENGQLNLDYVTPKGPVTEITDWYRSYNDYKKNDIVKHEYNGVVYEWKALHTHATGVEPGTDQGQYWLMLGPV